MSLIPLRRRKRVLSNMKTSKRHSLIYTLSITLLVIISFRLAVAQTPTTTPPARKTTTSRAAHTATPSVTQAEIEQLKSLVQAQQQQINQQNQQVDQLRSQLQQVLGATQQ